MAKESNKKDLNKKEEKVSKTDTSKKNKGSAFKDFKSELKKVVWPTPKELVRNTVAVISIVLIAAVIVFVLDLAFESLNTYGIDKIRDAVSSSVNKNETNSNNETISTENENTTDNSTADNTTTDEQGIELPDVEGENLNTTATTEE